MKYTIKFFKNLNILNNKIIWKSNALKYKQKTVLVKTISYSKLNLIPFFNIKTFVILFQKTYNNQILIFKNIKILKIKIYNILFICINLFQTLSATMLFNFKWLNLNLNVLQTLFLIKNKVCNSKNFFYLKSKILKNAKKWNFFSFFYKKQIKLTNIFINKKNQYNMYKNILIFFKISFFIFKKLIKNKKNYKKTLTRFNKYLLMKNDLLTSNTIIFNKNQSNYNKFNFFYHKIFTNKLKNFNFILLNKKNNFLFKNKKNLLSYINKNINYKYTDITTIKNIKKHNYFILNNIFDIIFNIKIFKYFYIKNYIYKNTQIINYKINSYINNFFLYSKNNNLTLLNLNKNINFNYILQKKALKLTSYQKFDGTFTLWYNNTIVRFIENCSGKKVFFKVYMFLSNVLNVFEKARCFIWTQKVRNFQKMIGQGLFLYESVQVMYIALKLKDSYFFINWMTQALQKINFWKHRLFFHYLKYIFKYFFSTIFNEIKIKGLKFKLKGKISVAGNARTRTITYQIGHVSQSTYNNKILHSSGLIKTFTGVLGLQIWLVF